MARSILNATFRGEYRTNRDCLIVIFALLELSSRVTNFENRRIVFNTGKNISKAKNNICASALRGSLASIADPRRNDSVPSWNSFHALSAVLRKHFWCNPQFWTWGNYRGMFSRVFAAKMRVKFKTDGALRI